MRALADFFSKILKKYMPNAFIFAVLLTFIVVVVALFVKNPSGGSNTIFDVVNYWGKGFWGLLGFAMQMALIVATGTALSTTPVVNRVLNLLADTLNTPAKAIIGTAFFTAIACFLQYGFGLIFGALLARKIAIRIRTNLHYPLLVAAAYSGFIVWHGGLSGSIPLKVAAPGADKAVVNTLGPGAYIPLSDTIFSPLNISIVLVLIIVVPITCYLMMPKKEDVVSLSQDVVDNMLKEEEERPAPDTKNLTPAGKLENSRLITAFTCILGFGYVGYYLYQGGGISLNTVLFIFLFLGLALHKTPINYISAFKEGVKETSGIILQFPFYAGIMGVMTASGIGLLIAQFFVDHASANTLPLYTFVMAGIVNFFVPSGGGQWAIHSHFVLDAAARLHADIPKVVMSIAWGDAWTNMIQPFWALPLLGVARLSIRDILGYTGVILIVSGVVIAGLFWAFLTF